METRYKPYNLKSKKNSKKEKDYIHAMVSILKLYSNKATDYKKIGNIYLTADGSNIVSSFLKLFNNKIISEEPNDFINILTTLLKLNSPFLFGKIKYDDAICRFEPLLLQLLSNKLVDENEFKPIINYAFKQYHRLATLKGNVSKAYFKFLQNMRSLMPNEFWMNEIHKNIFERFYEDTVARESRSPYSIDKVNELTDLGFNINFLYNNHSFLYYALTYEDDPEDHIKDLVNKGALLTSDETHGPAGLILNFIIHQLYNLKTILELLSRKTYDAYDVKIIVALLNKIPNPEYSNLMHLALKENQHLKVIFSNIYRLERMVLEDGGSASATWSRLILKHLDGLMDNVQNHDLCDLIEKRLRDETTLTSKFSLFSNLINDGWHFDSVLGRTIILEKSGKYRAIKLLKKDEPIQQLHKQYQVVRTLYEYAHVIGLKSQIPLPISVCKLSYNDLDNFLSQDTQINKTEFIDSLTVDLGDLFAYEYQTNSKDYFIYLNHSLITNEQFVNGAIAGFHDYIKLLVFYDIAYPQILDIFHTHLNVERRPDNGLYRPMPYLFNVNNNTGGRVDKCNKNPYPNARLAGMADEGDCIINVKAKIFEDEFFKNNFKNIPSDLKNIHARFIMHFLSVYYLSIELLAGDLANKQELLNKNDSKQIWLSMANNLSIVFTTLFSEILNNKDYANFPANAFDFSIYGLEMRTWMTPKHIKYIDRNKAPEKLYQLGEKVTINSNKFRSGTYDRTKGLALDPNKGMDLGPVNGPNPIKKGEGIRAAMTYMLVSGISLFKPKPSYDEHDRNILRPLKASL
ncbi:MAG: hypothetical protein A3F12_00980 [Gammaproteobacteria bacterium RIFCSPHIGHO2_12_FULL_38_14]|nr:MAG: hypothetical protein A3F12_00980 [Gammaproteobacteria bacterium RIFCSPHIGHO2_12_FULL_38_14]